MISLREELYILLTELALDLVADQSLPPELTRRAALILSMTEKERKSAFTSSPLERGQ